MHVEPRVITKGVIIESVVSTERVTTIIVGNSLRNAEGIRRRAQHRLLPIDPQDSGRARDRHAHKPQIQISHPYIED